MVAIVSGHLKSQIMQRPLARRGSTVKQSGSIPSSLDNEFGSSTDGTLADARARSLDEVVDCVVSHMSTSGLATSEAMNTRAVDLPATDAFIVAPRINETKIRREVSSIEPRSY